MSETKLLSVRIPVALADQIEAMSEQGGRSKTSVTVNLLSQGLNAVEQQELTMGFELLGDTDFQDMTFLTGAQQVVMSLDS